MKPPHSRDQGTKHRAVAQKSGNPKMAWPGKKGTRDKLQSNSWWSNFDPVFFLPQRMHAEVSALLDPRR